MTKQSFSPQFLPRTLDLKVNVAYRKDSSYDDVSNRMSMIIKSCDFGKGCEVNKLLESSSLQWWFYVSLSVVTVVKNLNIMGLKNTRRKDASQTRGLSKDGSGGKPRGQEVFYWMHDKRRARYNFAQMETEWWNEVEWMNLIDNGSTNFFQEHFLFLGLFSRTFYDFFFRFCWFSNFFWIFVGL